MSGIQNHEAENRPLSNSSALLALALFAGTGIPLHAAAATTNTQFENYIFDICNTATSPPGWDAQKVALMCFDAFPGGPAGTPGTVVVSTNLGTANASGGTASRKKKSIPELLEEQKQEPEKAASADGGGWGLLLAPQYGKNSRPETALENGFDSNLKGLLVGLDYRFSDSFILGAAIGHTKDDAAFLNGAGSLKTTNNTFTVYGTWVATERASVDGYLGMGKINFDSQRRVAFGPIISGIASGSTSGDQTMAGLSASYQASLGRVNLDPFVTFDYIHTRISGYEERGTTLLELRYRDRKNISATGSLGARSGTSLAYDWGTLSPSVRLAAVREFQNNAGQISNELVSTPGTALLVATDTPDRSYTLTGLGVTAALNSGTHLFLDYEKRNGDRLLDSWAVSIGVVVEFSGKR